MRQRPFPSFQLLTTSLKYITYSGVLLSKQQGAEGGAGGLRRGARGCGGGAGGAGGCGGGLLHKMLRKTTAKVNKSVIC